MQFGKAKINLDMHTWYSTLVKPDTGRIGRGTKSISALVSAKVPLMYMGELN